MKNKLLIFCYTLFVFCCSSYGQSSITEILVEKTILIEFPNGESGSGLIFQDTSSTYLITAKHVILNEIKDSTGKTINYTLKDKKGLLKYYSSDIEKAAPKGIEIDFLGLYNNGLLKYSKDADILICRIGKIDTVDYIKILYNEHVKKLNPQSSISAYVSANIASFDESELGNDIYIFGYPKALGLEGIYQYDFDRPLLRKGSLAGKYVANRTLVIDCSSFGGNSGGPVIEIIKNEAKIIGIVVSFIPLAEVWINPRYNIRNIELVNSGYSVVEPIDKIFDLIETFKWDINNNKQGFEWPDNSLR